MGEIIRFLNDYRSLNETACGLIERANEGQDIFMSTLEARWLGTGANEPPLSSRHRLLLQHLERISRRSGPSAPRLNAKILLLKDPTHEADPWQVVAFLRAGADVRYTSSEEHLRLIITGQEMLIAVSTRADKNSIVNCGVYYKSDVPNNPFTNYWRGRLLAAFKLGYPLVIDQNGVVKRAGISISKKIRVAYRSINTKDALLLLFGLSLGIIASLIAGTILGIFS